MMNKNKAQLLAIRKQKLIQQIEQQRSEMTAASQNWLKTTAPYDKAWQTVIAFRPIFIAATGLLSLYTLKKPRNVVTLAKKAITAWSLVRTLQTTFTNRQK